MGTTNFPCPFHSLLSHCLVIHSSFIGARKTKEYGKKAAQQLGFPDRAFLKRVDTGVVDSRPLHPRVSSVFTAHRVSANGLPIVFDLLASSDGDRAPENCAARAPASPI